MVYSIDTFFDLEDNQLLTDPFGLNKPIQIHSVSSGRDDGTNDLMALAFKDSMRHGSISKMVSNINNKRIKLRIDKPPGIVFNTILRISESYSTEIIFGGHGTDGLFEAGSGNQGFDPKAVVYEFNIDAFKTLERMKTRGTNIVSIYSCYTGAGIEGARLLFKLAKLWKVPVQARTGLTLISNKSRIHFEKGSRWQLARPEMNSIPDPISRPRLNTKSLLQSNFEDINIDFESIDHIQLTFYALERVVSKTISGYI
jgi:hypothetical protein